MWRFHLERNAVFAGVSAALASVFSKLALESGNRTLIGLLYSLAQPEEILKVVQALCIVFMILTNIIMWIFFTRSLQYHSSTAKATVLNSACNFFFSSFLGWLIFGEVLSLMWWAGFTLIIFGLVLMASDDNRTATPPRLKSD